MVEGRFELFLSMNSRPDARQWSVFMAFRRARSTEKPYIFDRRSKQAIYGFRGADNGYGAAKEQADAVFSLDQNFRTDAALLHALNIFGRHGGAADFRTRLYPLFACRPGLGAVRLTS